MEDSDFEIGRRDLLALSAASIVVGAFPARAAEGAVSVPASAQAMSLLVNGTRHDLAIDLRTSLLDTLREHLELTGTKKGCDHGQCGAAR